MNKQKTLLISTILCVVAIVLSFALKSRLTGTSSEDNGRTGQGNTQALPTESNPQENPHAKRERGDEAEALALRELEKEFDEILPATYPEQPSSLCDATLQPGESLVLGGFSRTDGNYEFTILEVQPIKADGTPFKPGETDGSPLQYQVLTKSLSMSREASSEVGLGSLISPAKTRIQKNLIFTSAEVMQIFRENTVGASTMPSVIAKADTSAVISIGTEKQGYAISMMASPVEGSESVRLRSRVESPGTD